MKFPLVFLFSEAFLRSDLPKTLDDDWSAFGSSWEGTIYATMLGLLDAGVECRATSQWPTKSIIIAHPRNFPRNRPAAAWKNYLVCWQQDHMRCDYAHCHIVMNSTQLAPKALSRYDRIFLPGPRARLHYLPEPSLIARSQGDYVRFNRIGYLGARKNLLPSMQTNDWFASMHASILEFSILDQPFQRSDYTDLDAVLAVRPAGMQVEQKSPHKLWNAWRAGVPAILGPEPGFRDYRKSDLDYIEVEDADQALQAITSLRDNPDLRRAMVENGKRRISECSVDTIIGQWMDFIDGPLRQYTTDWLEGPAWKRQAFGSVRTIRIALRRLKAEISKLKVKL